MKTDNPIHSVSHDRFGRDKFIDQFVDNIIRLTSDNTLLPNSFNIALYGRWGEGKTSILNCIRTKISEYQRSRRKYPTSEDRIIQIDFTPWLCLGSAQLLEEFFKTFIAKSGANVALKNSIAKYAGALLDALKPIAKAASAVDPFTGVLSTTAILAGSTFLKDYKNPTLMQLKEELNEYIGISGKYFVIYIDDIDRLDDEEVHLVLRMVKQVAGFRNTVFVLAMDQQEVAQSLKRFYSSSNKNHGGEFLEKIIQMPLYIPQIQSSKLRKYIDEELFEHYLLPLVNKSNVIKTKVTRVRDNILSIIAPLVSSPRQIIQLVNNLNATFNNLCLDEEVDVDTFVYLAFLKIVHFSGYEVIRRNRLRITGQFTNMNLLVLSVTNPLDKLEQERKIKEEANKAFMVEILHGAAEYHFRDLEQLVDNILYHHFNDRRRPFSSQGRDITDKRAFEKYFSYDVAEEVISEKHKKDMLETFCKNDIKTISSSLNKLVDSYTSSDVREALSDILKDAKSSSEFPFEKRCDLLVAASRIQECDMTSTYPHDRMFSWAIWINDEVVLIERFAQIDKIKGNQQVAVSNLYSQICRESDLMIATMVMSHLLEQHNYESFQRFKIDNSFMELVARYKKESEKLFNLASIDSRFILNQWKKVNNADYTEFMEQNFYGNVKYNFRLIALYYADSSTVRIQLAELFEMKRIFDCIMETSEKYSLYFEDELYIGIVQFLSSFAGEFASDRLQEASTKELV